MMKSAIENSDALTDFLYNEIKKSENKIKFDTIINKPNNFKPKTISFDEINNYNFNDGFIEFLISEESVHLYFDFDSLKSEDDFIDVYGWLESLIEIFGDFSYGGYTNNKEMADNYGFRFLENDNHFLSMHAVFYETRISTKDLSEIMKHTQKKGFHMNGINKFCDPNVYKLVSKRENQTTRQLFRHVLSDKIFKPNNPNNKFNHGFICEDKEPVTQIVQVRGNEPLITKEQWSKIFTPKETKKEQTERLKQERKQNNFDVEELEYNDDLIKLSKKELLELLNNFDAEFNVFLNDLAPLYHSPYTKTFLKSVLIKWYSKNEHQHDVEQTIASVLDRYYKQEETNRWYFSLIKKLPDDVRDKYKNYDVIDDSVNINTSNYTFEDFRKKRYFKNEFAKLLSDLRGVFGFCKGRVYIKEIKNKQKFIRETSMTKIHDEFTLYKPFKNNTKITLLKIVSKYSDHFLYDDVIFAPRNKDFDVNRIINIFQDFKYKESESNDFQKLQPLLDHIKNIVCNNDEEKYDYFMKWWACILQNITVKNGTMPIIYGAQGSGKSVPIELFVKF